MTHFRFVLALVFSWGLFSTSLFAQKDTIPRIVEGKVDWETTKGKLGAPIFNQKDVVMYMVRKEGLGTWFNDETSDAWVNDFHFIYLNGDQHLDAIYDGSTAYHLGAYFRLSIGDTTLSYPATFESRGYAARFYADKAGIGYIVRKDAYGADYLLVLSSYYYDYGRKSNDLVWEVAVVGDEQAPVGTLREQVVVKEPVQMRIAPEVVNDGGIDLDQDGKEDLNGNVSAVFDRGATFIRTLQKKGGDGQNWSFVIALDTPKEDFAYGTGADPDRKRFAAGWVHSDKLK